jgi:hypothetical protein
MGRIPVSALNGNVSSVSLAVPDGYPWMERPAMISCSGVMASGSGATPTITSFPFGPSPSTKAEIDGESGAVLRSIPCPRQQTNVAL